MVRVLGLIAVFLSWNVCLGCLLDWRELRAISGFFLIATGLAMLSHVPEQRDQTLRHSTLSNYLP
ncbi:hypothetical protein BDV95DRAFT_576775, partial [Massariosphaeria phaeospora]